MLAASSSARRCLGGVVRCARSFAVSSGSRRVALARAPLFDRLNAAAATTPMRAVGARQFGLLDKPMEYMQNKQKRDSDEMFRKQMADLLVHPTLTLGIYRDSLKAGLEQEASGWKGMVPGVKKSEQWVEMTTQIAFLDALTPAMLRNPRLVNGSVKKQIAEAIDRPVEKINEWLRNYGQLEMMHGWLRRQQAAGKQLPSTQAEAVAMMMKDPQGMSPKKMMRKPRGARR